MTYLEAYLQKHPKEKAEEVPLRRCRVFHFHDAENHWCRQKTCTECWNEEMQNETEKSH